MTQQKRDIPKTHRTRVYCAGPLTTGNTLVNVRNAICTATTLLKRGYAPYLPHLTALWEIASPKEFTYEDWMSLDCEWLGACDVLLRLPGESPGSDREVQLAMKMGIPVFLSLDTLTAVHPPTYSLA